MYLFVVISYFLITMVLFVGCTSPDSLSIEAVNDTEEQMGSTESDSGERDSEKDTQKSSDQSISVPHKTDSTPHEKNQDEPEELEDIESSTSNESEKQEEHYDEIDLDQFDVDAGTRKYIEQYIEDQKAQGNYDRDKVLASIEGYLESREEDEEEEENNTAENDTPEQPAPPAKDESRNAEWGDEDPNRSFKAVSNWDMAARMGKGINMGNTLEAPTEGAWAKAAEPYFFDDYKNNGFKNVRIPIKWGNHIDGNGTIDKGFMDRVEQVVDWSLSRGLVTIINAHHENWVIDNYWGNKDKLFYIWSQVADRFKGKNENLVFELFNEPRGAMGAGEVTDMNHALFPSIRSTNPQRVIIAGAGNWGHWNDLYNVSFPIDDYTMVQFHYYDPISFTHEFEYAWWSHGQIWSDMDTILAWVQGTLGIPAYCGEFGVMHSSNDKPRDWGAAVAYYDIVTSALKKWNTPYSVWDDAGWFGIYDRNGRSFNDIAGKLH
ncbi:MAG: glycoside hydrolase family 5 protein [Fibrobacterales bacterium]